MNGQCARYMPNVFKLCPHSHVKILDAEGWIKSRWKHNIEVKVTCAMWNKQIGGLAIDHSSALLPKQEWMRVLNVEKMELSLQGMCHDGCYHKWQCHGVHWFECSSMTCNEIVPNS